MVPQIKELKTGVGSKSRTKLREGLLVMTHTVPLQEQLGDAGVDPQQVSQGHHAATRHVVPTQTQRFYTAVSHNTL